MSSINTPTTSNNSPFIYKTPSEALIGCRWGKSSEKPAEKQQNFAGSDEVNQFAAESLLYLHSDVQFLKVASGADPLANATMKSVITSPAAVTAIKRKSTSKENYHVPKIILMLFPLRHQC